MQLGVTSTARYFAPATVDGSPEGGRRSKKGGADRGDGAMGNSLLSGGKRPVLLLAVCHWVPRVRSSRPLDRLWVVWRGGYPTARPGHGGALRSLSATPRKLLAPGDAGGGRQHLPVEMMLQHRGLPAWGPRPHPLRALAQPALVDEDDGAPLREGFFNSRPLNFLPHPDRLLVTLQRPPGGALAAPAELAHKAPDVGFIKRRDRGCRKCFSKRCGSGARARKANVRK